MSERNIILNPKQKLHNQSVLVDYNKHNTKKLLVIVILVAVTILFSLFAVTIGPSDMTMQDSYQVIAHKVLPNLVDAPKESIERTVWFVRVPRLLTGLLVGFSLAVAGSVMQPVLRNPMASPFTLGISSGAGFGAALAIIFGKSIGSGSYYVVANAFLFSLLTSFIILLLSKKKGTTPEIMILIGIALSHLFTAGTTVMQYFAESWATSEVVFWMVGSLSKGTWGTLKYIFPVVLVCVPFLIIKSWDLNSIGAGDDAAKSLGVDVERTRIILMIVAALITSTTICFTGTIGFVGLLAPHITRMIIGGDNRFIVPVSGIVGALLLSVSDTLAMNIISPVVIPIGVMTSFMGVPLFIYLIIKMRRNFN
ncbi:MAG: iron ABC transporter permease [Maledivibacter sp.]|jgi:iron complex transport system permease protein|nr:iron ABC transporter permease [Maledivibacter sp.]